MKFPLLPFTLLLSLSLNACHAGLAPTQASADKQASMASAAASTERSHARDPQSDPAGLLSDKLRSGMTYNEFRKVVLDQGWLPKGNAQCMANVVGGNYEKLCSAHPELASCRACAEVPELSACSGDGHCQVHFAQESSGAVLEANTYGPISDWNAPGERSRLTVTEWQVDAKPAH